MMAGVITETNIWSGLLKGNLPRLLAYTKQHYPYVPFYHYWMLGCVSMKGNEYNPAKDHHWHIIFLELIFF